jgi:Asp-tRNA(Asn)/Glu-tRNA(Gln) amidotransferase A subunit family amidase
LKVYSLVLDTLGVFARGVEDLEMILDVLGVSDDIAGGGVGFDGVKGAKFGLVKTTVWPQAGSGTIAAMDKAATILRSHGAIVEELDLPSEFTNMPTWHAAIMAADARTSFISEYRRDKGKISTHLTGYIENKDGYTHAQNIAALDGIASLRPRIDEIAGRYAALLTPSVSDEAPVGIQETGSAAFCSMWTVRFLNLFFEVLSSFCGGADGDYSVGSAYACRQYSWVSGREWTADWSFACCAEV